jgi:hypothetical protein
MRRVVPLLLAALAAARSPQDNTLTRTHYTTLLGSQIMQTTHYIWNVKVGDVPGITASKAAPFTLGDYPSDETNEISVYVPSGTQHSYWYNATAKSDWIYAGGRLYEWSPIVVAETSSVIVPLRTLMAATGTVTWCSATGVITYVDAGWQQLVEDLDARDDALTGCANPFTCTFSGTVNETAPIRVFFTLSYAGIGIPDIWRAGDAHRLAVGDLRLVADDTIMCHDTACRPAVWTYESGSFLSAGNDTVYIGLDTGAVQLVVHWRGTSGTVLPAWRGSVSMLDAARYDWAFMVAVLLYAIAWQLLPSPDQFVGKTHRGEWVLRGFVVVASVTSVASALVLATDTDWPLHERIRRASMLALTHTQAYALAVLCVVVAVAYGVANVTVALWPLPPVDKDATKARPLDVGRLVLSMLLTAQLLWAVQLRATGDTLLGAMTGIALVVSMLTIVVTSYAIGTAALERITRIRTGHAATLLTAAISVAVMLFVPTAALAGVLGIYPFVYALDELEEYDGIVTTTMVLLLGGTGLAALAAGLHGRIGQVRA